MALTPGNDKLGLQAPNNVYMGMISPSVGPSLCWMSAVVCGNPSNVDSSNNLTPCGPSINIYPGKPNPPLFLPYLYSEGSTKLPSLNVLISFCVAYLSIYLSL